MNSSFDPEQKVSAGLSEHFLYPSTLFVDRSPHRVQTILGSCIAVCVFDIKLSFGGINHYMLPWWSGEGIPSPKYGDVATEMLIKRMEDLGSSKNNMIAKVFGGANQHFQNKHGVGDRNIATAERLLAQHRICIVGKNTGGLKGRKIVFHTSTGQVMMKYLDKPAN